MSASIKLTFSKPLQLGRSQYLALLETHVNMSLHLWSTALALAGTVTPSFHRETESCHSSVAVQSKWANFGSIACRIYSTIINQWCCIMHGAESVLGTDTGTLRSCTSRLLRVCSDTYPLTWGPFDPHWVQMLSGQRGEIMWLTQSSLTWCGLIDLFSCFLFLSYWHFYS